MGLSSLPTVAGDLGGTKEDGDTHNAAELNASNAGVEGVCAEVGLEDATTAKSLVLAKYLMAGIGPAGITDHAVAATFATDTEFVPLKILALVKNRITTFDFSEITVPYEEQGWYWVVVLPAAVEGDMVALSELAHDSEVPGRILSYADELVALLVPNDGQTIDGSASSIPWANFNVGVPDAAPITSQLRLVLRYTGGTWRFLRSEVINSANLLLDAKSLGGFPVDVVEPSEGDFLRFNGTSWVSGSPTLTNQVDFANYDEVVDGATLPANESVWRIQIGGLTTINFTLPPLPPAGKAVTRDIIVAAGSGGTINLIRDEADEGTAFNGGVGDITIACTSETQLVRAIATGGYGWWLSVVGTFD